MSVNTKRQMSVIRALRVSLKRNIKLRPLQSKIMFRLDTLDQQSQPHAAAHAERCEAAPGFARLHLVQKGRRDSDSSATNRMAERDCATVNIQAFSIEAEIAVTRYDLRGEGFVEFD